VERVARRSQIERASRAASCHSRLLSARNAAVNAGWNDFSSVSRLRDLEEMQKWDIPWFVVDKIALEFPEPLNGRRV